MIIIIIIIMFVRNIVSAKSVTWSKVMWLYIYIILYLFCFVFGGGGVDHMTLIKKIMIFF